MLNNILTRFWRILFNNGDVSPGYLFSFTMENSHPGLDFCYSSLQVKSKGEVIGTIKLCE